MNIIVCGGSGGIGKAIVHQCIKRFPGATVVATWNSSPPTNDSVLNSVRWSQVNLTSEQSVQSFSKQFDKVHWLINAAGVLHTEATQGSPQLPEKSIRQLDPDFFLRNIQVNTLPTLLLAKHFESVLKHDERAHFATISAKVGSIEDNRLGGWHSYRCSKSALNMALKNISIEWRRRLANVCVTALHPGTTDTDLSAPFQRNVPEGKLFTADYTAACLVELLSSLTAADSGKFLAYDGREIPW